MRGKTGPDKHSPEKREGMCVEQIIIIFTRYGDMMCIALSAMTIAITGVTLHKLKKIETGLYKPAEAAEAVRFEALPEEQEAEEHRQEALAAEAAAKEQEKLLDAVLGEVFP